jgi:purine nucleosidase/pyrimidine-specific ribonucleoside hydrolase
MRLPILFLLMASVAGAQAISIILDTDIGDDIDDALALALALQSPELDVKAITTVLDRSALRSRLVWKELGVFGRRDIPIGTGVDEPFLDPVQGDVRPQFKILTSDDVVPGPPVRAVDLIIRTLLDSPRTMRE